MTTTRSQGKENPQEFQWALLGEEIGIQILRISKDKSDEDLQFQPISPRSRTLYFAQPPSSHLSSTRIPSLPSKPPKKKEKRNNPSRSHLLRRLPLPTASPSPAPPPPPPHSNSMHTHVWYVERS